MVGIVGPLGPKLVLVTVVLVSVVVAGQALYSSWGWRRVDGRDGGP